MATLSPLFTWRSAIVESELPPAAKHVALTLSLHMNERGGSCFPSLDTLATETSKGKDSVIAGLRMLEQGGWLSVKRSEKTGRGHKNHYFASYPQGLEKGSASGPFVGERVLRDPVKGPEIRLEGVKEDVKERNGSFKCRQCDGLSFKGPKGLAQHMKNVHDEVTA